MQLTTVNFRDHPSAIRCYTSTLVITVRDYQIFNLKRSFAYGRLNGQTSIQVVVVITTHRIISGIRRLRRLGTFSPTPIGLGAIALLAASCLLAESPLALLDLPLLRRGTKFVPKLCEGKRVLALKRVKHF